MSSSFDKDLKKAQTLLDVDFQLMIDTVLDDYDLQLLADYIHLLERQIDHMLDWSSWQKFIARDLYEQYIMFLDSAETQIEERKQFKSTLQKLTSPTATHIKIIGPSIPRDAEIADEIFEDWEEEEDLRYFALEVADILSTRRNIAQEIYDAIEETWVHTTEYDDPLLSYIFDLMFDEIDRVKKLPRLADDDNMLQRVKQVRQKFRDTRRRLRGDDV